MLHSRPGALTALCLLVPSAAVAQTPSNQIGDQAVAVGAQRYAGTYHVATETWTRGAQPLGLIGQPDNIYSNTAASGYFQPGVGPTGLAGAGSIVDEGGSPGTSNPGPFDIGGARDSNLVDSIRVGYCDLSPVAGVSGWRFVFYDSYAPCTYPPSGTSHEVMVNGLPSNGCWTIDIDLGGGMEFVLASDGGDGFDGDPSLDSFGIEWSYAGTGTGAAGLQLAGDPANTDPNWLSTSLPSDGSNTYYGTVGGCASTGTGYLTADFYWIEQGASGSFPAGSGCYFFGGYRPGASCGAQSPTPYGSYFIELSGGPAGPTSIADPGCVSAPNSTGVGATIDVLGSADPATNDALLLAGDLPDGSFVIFIAGLQDVPADTLNIGNGWLCINPLQGGGIGRLDDLSQVKAAGADGTVSLDSDAGEWDLSMIPTSTGTYAATAGVTSYFQAWFRDAGSFNFSDSASVTWQ